MYKNCYFKKKNKKRMISKLKIGKKNKQNKIELHNIKVKFVENPVHLAIEKYNIGNSNKIKYYTEFLVIERLTMNYIRHNLTNYDIVIKQETYKKMSHIKFQQEVNEKILSRYSKNFIKKELKALKNATFNT